MDRSETADYNNLGNFLSCSKYTAASFTAMKSFHYFTVLCDYLSLTFSDSVHTIRASYIAYLIIAYLIIVIFGAKSSPFILQAVLKYHLEGFVGKSEIAAQLLRYS